MNGRQDGLILKVQSGDDAEKLIRKFTRMVRNSGVVQEVLDRRFYEKPSVKKRKKSLKAKITSKKDRF